MNFNESKPSLEKSKHEILLDLSKSLGLKESLDSLEIKKSFELNKTFQENIEQIQLWCKSNEEEINKISDTDKYAKAQIGFMILTALVYKDFNEIEEYNNALYGIDGVVDYAQNIGLNNVVETLDKLR